MQLNPWYSNVYQYTSDRYLEQTKMIEKGHSKYWHKLEGDYQGFYPPSKHESYNYIVETLLNLRPKDWRRVALLQKGINYWGGSVAKMQTEGMKRRAEKKHVKREKRKRDVPEGVKQALESYEENNCTKTDTEHWDGFSI